jgi:hypothetical protein
MPGQIVSGPADRIRDRLDAGLLSRVMPDKTWAGFGKGRPCHGCSEPIHPTQVEYEFKEHPDSDIGTPFHIGCAGLWQAELRRRGW